MTQILIFFNVISLNGGDGGADIVAIINRVGFETEYKERTDLLLGYFNVDMLFHYFF